MYRPTYIPHGMYVCTLSTQLPFVNDAVYIILTELLFNAIAIAGLETGM